LGLLSGNGFDASAFNVVTLTGDFAPSSDVGGRVAVFGSYTGNGYQIDSQVTSVPNNYSETYALIVNKNITSNSFTLGAGEAESAYVGGTYSPSVFNGNKTTVVAPPTASDFSFTNAQVYLDNLSSTTLAAAGTTVTVGDNGTNFFVAPTGNGLFIYNVDASYFNGSLNQNRGFEVDLTSTSQSVIINITGAGATSLQFSKGTQVKIGSNFVNANTTGGVPVMFNIPTATSVSTSNGNLNGSILAPYATFSSPNQTVDGQLFVGSVNGLAETHDQYYSGTLPTSTPEPLTFVLMGAGLLAVGVLRGKKT
jgi:choice-of-anchor A domain-containing protein